MRSTYYAAFALPILSAAYKPCPLLGPTFPPPADLHHATVFQNALQNISATLDQAVKSSESPYGPLNSNATSFSVGIFDASNKDALFSYQYSSQALRNGTEGVREVTEDSVYRVGSLSKLIFAYLFMIEAGPKYWNHPVTEFVPELKVAAANCSAEGNPVDCIDWNHVTLGALLSHTAGIPRDYAVFSDWLYLQPSLPEPFTSLGLPPLSASEVPPCGLSGSDPCSREAFLKGIASEHPIYHPFTTPVYSNGGYVLLKFALENITGRPLEGMIQADLFNKLGMTRSYTSAPKNVSNAILPGGLDASGFAFDWGNEAPTGGYLSTQCDLVRLGQSILSSSLLSHVVTREWMKPVTHTSTTIASVGRPWEIWRSINLTDHVVDLYTKEGDIPNYTTLLVLIPDFKIGFVVLGAGTSAHNTVLHVSDIIVTRVLPALDKTARQQAQEKYAGTYSSTDPALNSSITITTQAGQAGLYVQSWISNSTDLLHLAVPEIEGDDSGMDIRLYPTNLDQRTSKNTQRVSFRGVFETRDTVPDGGVFSQDCATWSYQNSNQYGAVGVDEFLFNVQDDKVVSITPRGLRVTLERSR